jgi:hypothetical protein
MDSEFIVILVNIIIVVSYVLLFNIWFRTKYHLIITMLLLIFTVGSSIFTIYNTVHSDNIILAYTSGSKMYNTKYLEYIMIACIVFGHLSQFITLILLIISYYFIVNNKMNLKNYDNEKVLYIYKLIYIINMICVYLGYFSLNSMNENNVFISNDNERNMKLITYAIPSIGIIITSSLLYYYSVYYYKKNNTKPIKKQ